MDEHEPQAIGGTTPADEPEVAVVPVLTGTVHPETIRKKVRSAAAIRRRECIKAALERIAAGVPPAVAVKESGITAREFFKVLRASPSLDRAYELSRQAGAQVIADEGLELAEALSEQDRVSMSKVASMKLRLDYIRWYVGKLHPKTFEDRLSRLDDPGQGGGKVTVVVVMDDRKLPQG